jgi:serine/threonine protein kinase
LEDILPDLIVKREEPQTQQDLWNILEDLFIALAALQTSNVHHRDIKPANLFLVKNEGWRAKLGDFGFATSIEDELRSPLFCGSPLYMAPEFMAGYILTQFGWSLLRPLQTDQKDMAAPINSENLRTSPPNIKTYAAQMLPSNVLQQLDLVLENLPFMQRFELGRMITRTCITLGASLKGDIWAAGLMLYILRTGKSIYRNLENKTTENFIQEVLNLTPATIDQIFSSNIAPGSLEELNRRMLSIIPNERPGAQECLDAIRRIRASQAKFS